MDNINVPGVFPGSVAMLLAFLAVRCHFSYKKWENKQYKLGKYVCILGAVIYFLIAVFQILEVYGISFR